MFVKEITKYVTVSVIDGIEQSGIILGKDDIGCN